MGRRGPIAKAAASKKRVKKPVAKANIPACPTWFGPVAKQEWTRAAKELLAQGTISLADRAVLAAYCEAWEEFSALYAQLKGSSMLITGQSGTQTVNPLVWAKNHAAARIERFAKQLGLTPAARMRIDADNATALSPLAEQIINKREQRAKIGR